MNVLKAPHSLLILHVGFGIKRLIAAQCYIFVAELIKYRFCNLKTDFLFTIFFPFYTKKIEIVQKYPTLSVYMNRLNSVSLETTAASTEWWVRPNLYRHWAGFKHSFLENSGFKWAQILKPMKFGLKRVLCFRHGLNTFILNWVWW